MNVSRTIAINSPIRYIKELYNNYMAVVDEVGAVRLYGSEKFKLVGGFKTNIQQSKTGSSFISITPTGHFAAFAVHEEKKANLYSIHKKKVIFQVGRHNGDIESLSLDANQQYLVTGGEDGKVFIWGLRTGRLVYAMPPHSDYVTTVAFNDASTWLASGSYDRIINVNDIAIMQRNKKLRGSNGAIVKLEFLPDEKLLSVDASGGVIVWDYYQGKLLKRLPSMLEKITDITLFPGKRFLFVATVLGNVGLYDLRSNERIEPTFLKEGNEIHAIEFLVTQNKLAVGLSSGEIKIYNFDSEERALKEEMESQKYLEAYERVESNPILLHTPTYEKMESIWEDTAKKAQRLLEKEFKNEAKVLFEPFMGVPSKSAFVKSLLRDYVQFKVFKRHVKNRKFSLAYSLSYSFKSFIQSSEYRHMEGIWNEKFRSAEELIFTKNGDEAARDELKLFRGVPQKAKLIQKLFSERSVFLLFKRKLMQKDYIATMTLVKKHSFLKELPEYDALLQFFDTTYITAQKEFQAGNYAKAMQCADILLAFTEYADDAKDLRSKADHYAQFYSELAEKNISQVYILISKYPYLLETPEARKIEESFNKAVSEAEGYASRGDAFSAKKRLSPFFNINTKFPKISAIFKRAYLWQLEDAQKSDKHSTEEIEEAITYYVRRFGIDEEIDGFNRSFNESERKAGSSSPFLLEDLRVGNVQFWTPKMIIKSIFDR